MEAKKAKAISDGIKRRAELTRAGNIYLDAILKEVKGRAYEGCTHLTVRTATMDLTDKDVTDLELLGYEVKHEHVQNWDAWEISW